MTLLVQTGKMAYHCIMKQKLLFISHMAGLSGGGEKSLLQIVLSLKAKDYLCHVILPGEGEFSKRLSVEGISHTVLTYKWSEYIPDDGYDPNREENMALHIANTMIDFERAIIDIKPDIVITNTIVAPWGMYIAKAHGLPGILLVREWLFGEDEMKMVPDNNQYIQMAAMCSDKVIFNSKDLMEKYREYFLHSDTSVMYPDVGLSETTIKEHYRDNTIGTNPSILIAGVIAPHKNQIEAVRGIRIALDLGMNIGDILIIGKSGDPDYYQALSGVISECGLTEMIKVREYADDFYYILNEYNIVLVPSKAEPFGRITLEAQLFGRVVIGSNSGGTSELIVDRETGLLYNYGDVYGLANTLKWVADNTDEAEKIGETAKVQQMKRFVGKDLLNPLEESINELLTASANHERDRSFDPLFAAMSKIAKQEEEIEGIRNSHAFKIGNAAVTPLRKLKER